MISDPNQFFVDGCGRCERFATDACSARLWSEGLAALRALCLEVGLQETAKWGHPCYMHAGRNIAILGAFRAEFRLSFFDAALMTDPHGLLERQGENSRHPDALRFRDAAEVRTRAALVRAYLVEAMGYAQDGIRPAKVQEDLVLPDELTDALDADPELAEGFTALTPGRQKSWALHVGYAKQSATRTGRILKGREKILAGKGAMER